MAFVNDYLTKEERERLVAAEIREPFCYWGDKLNVLKGTIDREKDMMLIYCGVYDREDYHKDVFAFLWKEWDEGHLVEVVIEGKRRIEYTKYWKMIEMVIPTQLQKNKEQILYDFTEALSIYGICGEPGEDGVKYKIKAVIEFE